MSDTLEHGRHQFGKKIFVENIVNHSWAIRLGLGLARHGAIPGNSGCPEGVPGVFQECFGPVPGFSQGFSEILGSRPRTSWRLVE